MTESKDLTGWVLIRGSRSEKEILVSIAKKEEFDLTDYRYLGQSNSNPTLAEWVWKDDIELYRKARKVI
jgi:hypothetical protein